MGKDEMSAKTESWRRQAAVLTDLLVDPTWKADHMEGRILARACAPWEDSTAEPPDWDSPLHQVFDAGVTYAERLLAKRLGVTRYTACDGTESYDGDLGGTLCAIVVEWRAQQIYNSWRDQPEWTPWIPGGNSDKQCEARDAASDELHTDLANVHEGKDRA